MLVAEAMVAGGAGALADSRPASIARLRRHLPETELHLLRSQLNRAPLASADLSSDLYFVSSAAQAESFLRQAPERPLSFCLTIETGDGREGVPPGQAREEAERLMGLHDAVLAGVATNAACARADHSPRQPLNRFRDAVLPILKMLDDSSDRSPADLKPHGPVISAGGSGLLRLFVEGQDSQYLRSAFEWLTDFRCGEAILLGSIPGGKGEGAMLPGGSGDAFIIEAPVLEVFRKEGRLRVIFGLGIQDTGAGRLRPLNENLQITQVTSDYLSAVYGGDPACCPAVGDHAGFIPSYYALLGAMTSPHVEKVSHDQPRPLPPYTSSAPR
jgi:predicted amino acid racemase